MDVYKFDNMPMEDKFEYFWECSQRVDTYKGDSYDYFLHRDKFNKDFYIELSLQRMTKELGLKGMSKTDMYIKYRIPHVSVGEDPWE